MNIRSKAIGGALGVAAFVAVGMLATSGQFVDSGRDTLASLLTTCTEGQQPRKVSGVWACADGGAVAGGDITAVTTSASSGLSGGCTSGVCAITMLATCNIGEALRWDGSSWVCRQTVNDYRSKHLEWNDEWIYSAPTSLGPWAIGVSGSGATSATVNNTSRPGVVSLSTGTTTTGRAGVNLHPQAANLDTMSATYEAFVAVPVLSTSGNEFAVWNGLGTANSSIDQSFGCGFLYDRGNVATNGDNSGNLDVWECYCANSTRTVYRMDGARTSDEGFVTVNAPVAAVTFPSTNVVGLRIVTTPGVRVEFYVNSGSGFVKSCDINTNIPSNAGPNIVIAKTAGTTARLLDIDYTRLALDLTSARTP